MSSENGYYYRKDVSTKEKDHSEMVIGMENITCLESFKKVLTTHSTRPRPATMNIIRAITIGHVCVHRYWHSPVSCPVSLISNQQSASSSLFAMDCLECHWQGYSSCPLLAVSCAHINPRYWKGKSSCNGIPLSPFESESSTLSSPQRIDVELRMF